MTDPQSDFEVYDQKFREVVTEQSVLVQVATGMEFTEGPVWIEQQGALIFSDIPADEMKIHSPAGLRRFRKPSGNANGNTLDREGRLLTCEHGNRCLSRTEPDGKIVILADSFNGKRLNSPNDVVVKSDGSIWFTDPPYGIRPEQIEQPLPDGWPQRRADACSRRL